MKMTVNAGMIKEMFVNCDRDYYSFSGLETLLDYYDEIDPEMEFDPVAICCDCTEYSENAACSFDDLISDYGYKYPVEEWIEDNALKENEFDNDLYIDSLVERLEDETTVLHVPNGNYIVFAF
jgi:hypothetical protein